jgi:hypothetical protein
MERWTERRPGADDTEVHQMTGRDEHECCECNTNVESTSVTSWCAPAHSVLDPWVSPVWACPECCLPFEGYNHNQC